MATKTVHGHNCDDCWIDHLRDVDAEEHYVISIDGGPPKRFDFCSPSERLVMSRILRLYYAGGDDLEKIRQASQGTAPQAFPEEQPAKPKAVTPRKPKEPEQAPKQKPSASKRKGPQIWCPLEHKSEGGKGKFVSYKGRVTHARQHDLEIWEIKWKDVHGILDAPCHAHAECLSTDLKFINQQGVNPHISKVSLQRIDTRTSDNQASDEHD